jgi:hypothetical protein
MHTEFLSKNQEQIYKFGDVKVKVHLSLCHEDKLGSGGIAPPFLTLALDGGEWSASHPCRFTPAETAPLTHWIGGWTL